MIETCCMLPGRSSPSSPWMFPKRSTARRKWLRRSPSGGNDPLCDLHDLDILDKHFLIVPALAEIQFGEVAMRFGLQNVGRFGFVPTCDIVETESSKDVTIGAIQPRHYRNPPFQILFGPGPFEYKSVIPTLHQLSQLV